MALSRERKTALIIMAAEILKRVPADRVIIESGGSVAGTMYQTKSLSETEFLAELLDNTIVFTQLDPAGVLRVAPRAT